ncbi:hypothetical protein G6011_10022 [Alternaria panax]|uniref:Uncharacterized protein n=1 Tax=Alternaria panax TaxID=48097 RepID=A0AAD4I8K9_9PLEO|nr:hypothetical protein G6011_10022 [Alternaria panax]
MLIHFETKRRWNITISTTRKSLVEETTGPSAGLCTFCNQAFAISVNNTKSSAVAWHPEDSAEEDWSPSNGSPIFKCRNFLRKVCRLSRRTDRMDPQRYTTVTYDESPPPYQCRQIEELPAWPVHELPDQHMHFQELEGHHGLTELESPVEQTEDHTLGFGLGQVSYSYTSSTDKGNATADPMVLQQPTFAEAPRLSWDLDTPENFESVPSMASSGQSHKPSPVSPVTPDVDSDYATQLHQDGNLAAGTVSLLGSISPYDSSWARLQPVGIDCSYASHASLPKSLGVNPVEPFQEVEQQSHAQRLDVRQSSCLPFTAPLTSASHGSYIPNNHTFCTWAGSLLQLQTQWHDTTNIPLGDYEYSDDLGWQYRDGYGRETAGSEEARLTEFIATQPESSQHASHFYESRLLSLNHIKLHDRQGSEFYMESKADGIDHPLKRCDQCDRTFSGKYGKGNLRRHIIAFHNPQAVVLGGECRVCKKAYNRADATRKHEWEKHHILDAKPRKRAK